MKKITAAAPIELLRALAYNITVDIYVDVCIKYPIIKKGMDSIDYKIMSAGDAGFFLTASIEDPYMHIVGLGHILHVRHTDNKVFYSVRPSSFLHKAGFLGKYLNGRTFRAINKNGRISDVRPAFGKLSNGAGYAARFNEDFDHLSFDIPAPMFLESSDGIISLNKAIDTQIAIQLQRHIEELHKKKIILP